MLIYIVNFGEMRTSLRKDIDDAALAASLPYIEPGLRPLPPPFEAFECRTSIGEGGELLVSFEAIGPDPLSNRGRRACFLFGVAVDGFAAEPLWPELEKVYRALNEIPGAETKGFRPARKPRVTPWCSAVTLACKAEEFAWMNDMMDSIAWAWLERRRAEQD